MAKKSKKTTAAPPLPKIPAPPEVVELVERFREHADHYRASHYNETQLRRDFLDPLLKALGWDVHNEQGHHEAYREVIHEDAIKIGGHTKAPDYCCRVGGGRKFFVEAKKPSVDIREDVAPAFQLRRYAWSAKLPLSILTDFEELAVYDCRVRPAKTDKASTARVMYLRYDEYPERWGELAGVFSREAILKGSFDKYAGSMTRKRGTAEVDDAFLDEIEQWRDLLARNFALRNKDLSQRDLNFAVQRTIDRIVFLRICEDRGIEPYGTLQALLGGPKIYERLFERFRRADERYNSGLFHFEPERDRPGGPDELTPSLKLDDKPLKEILTGLYYPESPYEFAVLPADILGQVYEQFLGKVIRLTPGHQAKVEQKPEVRKAGGVYYTPTYIVDYIVEQTVGKLVEGKTPQQVGGLTETWRPSKRLRPITVLDPACGSGSFLLGAYQFLLDWYRQQYLDDDPQKHARGKAPRLYQHGSGEWRLTTAERKRILTTHIYGVDIDSQAVETTKLSLLLKVLEGESEQSLDNQRRMFHERALPDLSENIKCGNSLIGPDFYDNQQMGLFDEEDFYRVNAFDWEREFPHILMEEQPGFDAVIGNPPWGQKTISDSPDIKEYVRDRYPSTAGIYDLFRAFVERGIRLLDEYGSYGMVLPDIVLLKDYPATRRYLLNNLQLEAIDWWGMAFADAVIDAATVIGVRRTSSSEHCVRVAIHGLDGVTRHTIPQADFASNPRCTFNLYMTPAKRRIIKRLEDFPALGDYFEVHEGVHSGNIRRDLFVSSPVDDTCEELLFGRDEIRPYRIIWNGRYLRMAAVPEKKTKKRYANIGREEWHRQPKVLVRRTGDHVLAAVDDVGRFVSNNFFLVFPRSRYRLDLHGLCALLNSRFMTWYFRTIEPRRGRVFAELKIKHLVTFPMPREEVDAAACDDLNRLGREHAKLCQKALVGARTPHTQVTGDRMRSVLAEQIERVVGDLFQLPGEMVREACNLLEE